MPGVSACGHLDGDDHEKLLRRRLTRVCSGVFESGAGRVLVVRRHIVMMIGTETRRAAGLLRFCETVGAGWTGWRWSGWWPALKSVEFGP